MMLGVKLFIDPFIASPSLLFIYFFCNAMSSSLCESVCPAERAL